MLVNGDDRMIEYRDIHDFVREELERLFLSVNIDPMSYMRIVTIGQCCFVKKEGHQHTRERQNLHHIGHGRLIALITQNVLRIVDHAGLGQCVGDPVDRKGQCEQYPILVASF